MSGVDSAKYISAQQAAALVHYIPRNLGELGDYYRRFIDPPDVMIIKACPMDVDGYFNLSASNLWHRDAAASAKVVIGEHKPAAAHHAARQPIGKCLPRSYTILMVALYHEYDH